MRLDLFTFADFTRVSCTIEYVNFGASLSPAELSVKCNRGDRQLPTASFWLCFMSVDFQFYLKKLTTFSLLLSTVLVFHAKETLVFKSRGLPAVGCLQQGSGNFHSLSGSFPRSPWVSRGDFWGPLAIRDFSMRVQLCSLWRAASWPCRAQQCLAPAPARLLPSWTQL